MNADQVLLAVAPVLGSAGAAGIITAILRRPVDRSTAAKTDGERYQLLLDEHREDIDRLRAEVREVRAESRLIRDFNGRLQAWAEVAVREVRRLGGRIDEPPQMPDPTQTSG